MSVLENLFDGIGLETEAKERSRENASHCDPDQDLVLSAELVDFFSLSILTVPDVDRIGIPQRFSEDKSPVDLAGLDELSWGDVRRLIVPGLPDEQLAEIHSREKARVKPRAKVLEAIQHEVDERGGGFETWIEETSLNPFTSRVAAIAWRDGFDGLLQSFACVGDTTERDVFSLLREEWRKWDSEADMRGFARLGGFSLDWILTVLQVRACGVGLLDPFWSWRPLRKVGPGSCEDAIRQAGGLQVAAQAIGVAPGDLPCVPSGLDVWLAFRGGDAVQLSDWCAGKLQLEGELISALGR